MEGLGRLHDEKGACESSTALYEAEGMGSVWPQLHLGNLFHDEGDIERAESAPRAAADLDPLNVPAGFEPGIVIGRLAAAGKVLEAAARLVSEDPEIQYSLSGIYRRQGRATRGKEAVERLCPQFYAGR